MPAGNQLVAQFRGVVSLAVVGYPYGPCGVRHGLASALAQIHDRQAGIHEQTFAEGCDSVAIWAAMMHGLSHPFGRSAQRLHGVGRDQNGPDAYLALTLIIGS